MSATKSSVLSEIRALNGVKFITAAESPIKVNKWRLLVQPLPPKKNAGLLELTEGTQEAEEIITVVAKVIDMGEFAYKSKTNAGLDLAQDPRNPQIGDFVLHLQYAGQHIELTDEQKTKLRIIDDTEVLAIVTDPEMIKRYI